MSYKYDVRHINKFKELRDLNESALTRDIVIAILSRNTDQCLLGSLSYSALASMRKVLLCNDLLTKVSREEELLRMRTFGGIDKCGEVCNVCNLIDSVSVALVIVEDDLVFKIFDNGNEVFNQVVAKWKVGSYFIENMGSGKRDDGTYYLSVCMYQSAAVIKQRFWLALVLKDGGTAIEDVSGWVDTIDYPYLVYSAEDGEFCKYYQIPNLCCMGLNSGVKACIITDGVNIRLQVFVHCLLAYDTVVGTESDMLYTIKSNSCVNMVDSGTYKITVVLVRNYKYVDDARDEEELTFILLYDSDLESANYVDIEYWH